MSLSGLEEVAHIRAILQSLLGGNAESNAAIAELLPVVQAWPSLSASSQAKILKLVVVPPKSESMPAASSPAVRPHTPTVYCPATGCDGDRLDAHCPSLLDRNRMRFPNESIPSRTDNQQRDNDNRCRDDADQHASANEPPSSAILSRCQ